jgi:branched-chain amino acid transport system permease protein
VFSFELLVNALVAGLLLGGFYAAVALGLSIAFGLLEVVNIAHPTFVILGSYAAYVMNTSFGLDPVLAGVLFTPVFFGLGVAVYGIYYISFEKKGEQALRGLVFFFGLMFIIEVALVLQYGVDYRLVEAPYIGTSFTIGGIGFAPRLFVPFLVGVGLTLGLYLFLSKTFYGRAIKGVGGLGSIGGTLAAALIIGVAESLTSTFYGPSWSLAVSFGMLLCVLAVRPAGLFGR